MEEIVLNLFEDGTLARDNPQAGRFPEGEENKGRELRIREAKSAKPLFWEALPCGA
jgi:hypothetical protein